MNIIPWPECMKVETPANAIALEKALTWVCISCEMAPLVRPNEQSFMNALKPHMPGHKRFDKNLAHVQADLDRRPAVRNEFITAYFAYLVTR